MPLPVLLVHGIWDTGSVFGPMRKALLDRGFPNVSAIDLTPNDGSADIPTLAKQVDNAARALGGRIDLVGFSMGALVSRYWLQKLGGRDRVRRFISISGPHRGTISAHLSQKPGAIQMRPNSALLNELEAEEDPWGGCEVHAFWTPFDLFVFPPNTASLPGAKERTFNVLMHPLMPYSGEVITAVAEVFGRPDVAAVPP